MIRVERASLPDGHGGMLDHYISDGSVVIVGPLTGPVETADGTLYDVSPAAIEVHPDHEAEVAELIGQRYMLEGHPAHLYSDQPFVHVPDADMAQLDGPTMGISTAMATQMLDGGTGALVGTVNYMAYTSLNTGATGATGANEMTGVTRQATAWNNAASGQKTNSSSLTYPNPGTTAATNFSTWTAATAGSFGVGGGLSAGVTAASITAAPGALAVSMTSTS